MGSIKAVTTDSAISLTWDEPVYPNRNGIITNYTVTWEDMGQPQTAAENNTAVVTEPAFNLTDRAAFTVFTFSIAASTSVGLGPYVSKNVTTGVGGTSEPTRSSWRESFPVTRCVFVVRRAVFHMSVACVKCHTLHSPPTEDKNLANGNPGRPTSHPKPETCQNFYACNTHGHWGLLVKGKSMKNIERLDFAESR